MDYVERLNQMAAEIRAMQEEFSNKKVSIRASFLAQSSSASMRDIAHRLAELAKHMKLTERHLES